jgi:hypothetical protein
LGVRIPRGARHHRWSPSCGGVAGSGRVARLRPSCDHIVGRCEPDCDHHRHPACGQRKIGFGCGGRLAAMGGRRPTPGATRRDKQLCGLGGGMTPQQRGSQLNYLFADVLRAYEIQVRVGQPTDLAACSARSWAMPPILRVRLGRHCSGRPGVGSSSNSASTLARIVLATCWGGVVVQSTVSTRFPVATSRSTASRYSRDCIAALWSRYRKRKAFGADPHVDNACQSPDRAACVSDGTTGGPSLAAVHRKGGSVSDLRARRPWWWTGCP